MLKKLLLTAKLNNTGSVCLSLSKSPYSAEKPKSARIPTAEPESSGENKVDKPTRLLRSVAFHLCPGLKYCLISTSYLV